jgi:hypothetical protein
MKAQAPEVSDDQVIAQAIKSLRAGPLQSPSQRATQNSVGAL